MYTIISTENWNKSFSLHPASRPHPTVRSVLSVDLNWLGELSSPGAVSPPVDVELDSPQGHVPVLSCYPACARCLDATSLCGQGPWIARLLY